MKLLKNSNIKFLLFLSFFIIFGIMALFSILSSNQLNRVMERYNAAIYSSNARQSYIENLEVGIGQLRTQQMNLFYSILNNDLDQNQIDDFATLINNNRESVLTNFRLYTYSVINDEFILEEELINRISLINRLEFLSMDVFFPRLEEAVVLLQANHIDEFVQISGEYLIPVSSTLISYLISLNGFSIHFTEYLINIMEYYDQLDNVWLNTLTIITFVVAIGFAFFITNYITKPILLLQKNVKGISSNTESISSENIRLQTKNEIGDLSNEIANMVDTILAMNNTVEIQKEYESKLEEALSKARHANQAKSDFIANTSHEIRTPMNSIIGYGELALSEDIPDSTRSFLNKIDINAKWLLNIINDIMDFSKIEANKLELHKTPFNLSEIVEHCTTSVFSFQQETSVDFRTHIQDLDHILIIGDYVKLGQICINILSNALKFTESGYVDFSILKTAQNQDDITLKFVVKDTGIGMTQDQVQKIFEPFVQASKKTTNKYGGTGLGLAISRRLIQLMGGTLLVDSTPALGSTFSFELNFNTIEKKEAKETKEAASALEARKQDIDKPYFTDAYILIAEDNTFNQEVLKENLIRCGISPQVANHGEEAVNIIKKSVKNGKSNPFDLIFMDINMPVMDGIEATSIIKELNVNIPIIATTANLTLTRTEVFRKYGMDDFLSKPFIRKDLYRILNEYIERKSIHTQKENDVPDSVDEDFLSKMQEFFIEKNSDAYDKIKVAIENNNFEIAYTYAHNLKSNSGYIGQHILENIAEDLVKTFQNNEHDDVLMDKLQKELDLVLEQLEKNPNL